MLPLNLNLRASFDANRDKIALADRSLDAVGYLPVLSYFSGAVRVTIGAACFASGVALLIFKRVQYEIQAHAPGVHSRVVDQREMLRDAELNLIGYGATHLTRGILEISCQSWISFVLKTAAFAMYELAIDRENHQHALYSFLNEGEKWLGKIDLNRPLVNHGYVNKEGLQRAYRTAYGRGFQFCAQLSAQLKAGRAALRTASQPTEIRSAQPVGQQEAPQELQQVQSSHEEVVLQEAQGSDQQQKRIEEQEFASQVTVHKEVLKE